jgi:hypothetical protein
VANWYLSSRAYEDITPWGGQQNMLLQSNSFTTTWTATNCTPSQSGTDADPFGGTTAWRLTDNTSVTVTHGVSQGITKAATALRYMFSFYAKAGPTLTRVRASIGDSNSVSPTNGYFATFDLANGFIGAGATIIGAGFTLGQFKIEPVFGQTGWYRCQLSVVSTTGTTLGCAIITDNATGFAGSSSSYTGTTNYILIAGAQLEPALWVAGKYTATTTAAVAQTVSFSATVGMIRRPTDPGWISNSVGVTTIGFATSTGLGAERAYRCTTAGTTAAAEPSAAGGNPWTMKAGATVTDNAAVWTEVTGNESFQAAGSWAPYARLFNLGITNNITVNTLTSFPTAGTGYAVGDILAVTGVTFPADYPIIKVSTVSAGAITAATILDPGAYAAGTSALATTKLTGAGSNTATVTLTTSNYTVPVAGETIYAGNQHCEFAPNLAVTHNLNGTLAAPLVVLSVDQSATGHVPPTSADYLAGGMIAVTGSSVLTLTAAGLELYGISLSSGSATSNTGISLGSGNTALTYARDCKIIQAGSSGGGNTFAGRVILDNTPVRQANAGSSIAVSDLEWKNTAPVLITGGVVPTGGLLSPNATVGTIRIEAVDLSAMSTNRIIASNGPYGSVQLIRCKLPSSALVTVLATGIGPRMDLIQCDSGSLTLRNERYWSQGILTTDTSVIRTGGATDGGTAIAWRVATTANNMRGHPFEIMRSAIYNSTVGSSVNVSIFGVCNIAAPTTGDLWLKADSLSTASSTLGTITTQVPITRLASTPALTADTSAWDTAATARANTTAYSVGNVIKVATNPGRIFICTTAGTSAGSEPGGYASAVDGGSVTDNTAVFRAGYRFKQTVAVTPQNAGLIYAIIKIATASTTGLVWIDPQIVLS